MGYMHFVNKVPLTNLCPKRHEYHLKPHQLYTLIGWTLTLANNWSDLGLSYVVRRKLLNILNFFSGTMETISTKFGIKHLWLERSKKCKRIAPWAWDMGIKPSKELYTIWFKFGPHNLPLVIKLLCYFYEELI